MNRLGILKTAIKFGMRKPIAVLPPQGKGVVRLEPQVGHVDAGYAIKLTESEKREIVSQVLALPKEVDSLVRQSLELDAKLHSANLNQQGVIGKIKSEKGLASRIAILAPKGEVKQVLGDRNKVRTLINALNPAKYERTLLEKLEWAYEDGVLQVLQARPITALPDAVEWTPPMADVIGATSARTIP